MSSSAYPLFNQQQPGNNQYGAYGTGMPGIVPQATNTNKQNPYPISGDAGPSGGVVKQGGTGYSTVGTMFPSFTQDFYDWMSGQVGQGATPFNLSAVLPSTGQVTQPGQVNAPLSPLLQQLQSFYQTGQGGPAGTDVLGQMAKTGMPTAVGPAWDAMIKAQGQNTAQQEAQIREQFASLGSLKGSPFGTALTNFGEQNVLNQNALLAQMQQQSSEAAAGRQLSAGSQLSSQASDLGQLLQGLDQQSINNMMQEFIRTRPEYGPLLNMLFSGATASPQVVATPQSGWSQALTSLTGLAGNIASGPIGGAIGGALFPNKTSGVAV